MNCPLYFLESKSNTTNDNIVAANWALHYLRITYNFNFTLNY